VSRAVKLLAIAALPCLTTCCPTLWIQLQRSSPTVWPSVPAPAIADVPVLPPGQVPNRFDVFVGGTHHAAHEGYSDAVDQTTNGPAWLRAVEELGAILTDTHSTLTCTASHAVTIECSAPGQADVAKRDCRTLVVPQGDAPRVVYLPAPHALRAIAGRGSDVDHPGYDDLDLGMPIDVADGAAETACYLDDIQLRDPSVTLTDPAMSHRLDYFDALSSFEYDPDMALYNQYVTQAVFATIDQIVHTTQGADQPQFVIHTGDSIDSGAMTELIRFHALIDTLAIPFYDLFGNHDALIFGNLLPNESPHHDTDSSCAPIASLLDKKTFWFAPNKLCVDQHVLCPGCIDYEADIVARDTPEATRAHFMSTLRHAADDRTAQVPWRGTAVGYCTTTTPPAPGIAADPYTKEHGFDLGDDTGYYAFAIPLATTDVARNAVFVALDSEDLPKGRGGEYGRLGLAQATWLRGVLDCVHRDHPRDLVFVLAHQPLSIIAVEQPDHSEKTNLADLLDGYAPNVVGFLFGHNHAHQICGDDRKGVCTHYWEVETASLIEFPQEGRIVRIKQVAGDLAFFELTVFHERLANPDGEIGKLIDLARAGAQRDFCHTKPTASCTADQRVYRQDGRDANARLFFKLP
jgi:hypothetical protein